MAGQVKISLPNCEQNKGVFDANNVMLRVIHIERRVRGGWLGEGGINCLTSPTIFQKKLKKKVDIHFELVVH